jgi:Cytochrome c-type biogenesis protein CcmE
VALKRKHQRLAFVALGLAVLGIAVAIVLTQIEDHLVFFHSPSDLATKPELMGDRRVRLGGLVEEGSVARQDGGVVSFRVTDLVQDVAVTYKGILPDLFREGQGVVVEGRMRDGVFVADQVLAKHDENYMPPEVAKSLKQSGQWQHMREQLEQNGQITPRDAAGQASAAQPAAGQASSARTSR